MATDVLFTGTPAVTNAADAAPGLSLGTRIEVVNAGFFIGIRWRFPDTLPASTVQWRVDGYNPATDASTGTIRSGTFTAPVAGTYVTEFFTPFAVSPGDEFVFYIWTPDRYVGTINFFTANVNSVSGNYLGTADDTGVPARRNGRFTVGAAIAFPTSGASRFGYFVDGVWSDTEGTVTATLAATLPAFTGDFAAQASTTGDLAATLPAFTGAFSAEASAAAQLNATLPAFVSDIVGLVNDNAAVLNATLPAFTGQFRGVSAAGGQTVGPCGWTIPDPLCCGEDWAAAPPDVQSAARDYAATILWAATGRQFGLCQISVRPCGIRRCNEGWEFFGYDWSGGTWVPYIFNGQWFNCMCPGVCCCEPRCQVRLMGPVEEIVEVLIGGVAVDPATYYMADEHWLVRTGGHCWPYCADLNELVGEDTFEVTYLRGTPVPAALLNAAATLACEWAKACLGGDCRLSNRVTSVIRQGITIDMVTPEQLLDSGLTGLWEVDTLIKAYNPHRTVERLRIYAPELNVPKTVTWP